MYHTELLRSLTGLEGISVLIHIAIILAAESTLSKDYQILWIFWLCMRKSTTYWNKSSMSVAMPQQSQTKCTQGKVRAARVPPQYLPGWAEQARLQEILWSGKSLGIQDQVSNVSWLVDKQWALILSQSSSNWNLCNTWHVYSPRKQSFKDLFHFTFNLHFKNCITDNFYLSLHQCRDPNEQNIICNLLLFKLV